MTTPQWKAGSSRKWPWVLAVAFVAAAAAWGVFYSGNASTALLVAQSEAQTGADPYAATSPVFTPAHSSFGESVRHFFGMRPTPVQPIAYTHRVHIEIAQLDCTYCHSGVSRGPMAGIPGINTCMDCHFVVATDRPAIQEMTAYYDRGEDLPWQRVYGWNEEAHVRFNHAPHIRAEVECLTCHGNVAEMDVAERVVNHTMGFCVNCHTQNEAPNDCLTCHY